MSGRTMTRKTIAKIVGVNNFSYLEGVYDPETGSAAQRWVIMVPGLGCEWARCYMCGFSTMTERLQIGGKQCSKLEILIAYYLGRYIANPAFVKPKFVALYNGGSFLNNNEIPAPIQKRIIKEIAKIQNVKEILIESRPEYVSERRIKNLQRFLREDQILVVGIGLECQSDVIRERCINKGFRKKDYKKAVKALLFAGAKILTYVLLKPPYLNEREAIEEAIETIKYAFSVGSSFAALQSTFVQEGTLVHQLYLAEKYYPPSLWSIIKVVTQGLQYGPIHIGSLTDEPSPIAIPANCGKCDAKIISAFQKFNTSQDISVFQNIDCLCKQDWKRKIKSL